MNYLPTLRQFFAGAMLVFTVITRAVASDSAASADHPEIRSLYEVGYAHLDTQWRWSYPQVIGEYIPNTMWDNFPLFEKYPNYVFNFTGANRYRMMKEYYPLGYAEVKKWVAKGRWFPAGSSWEEGDTIVSSSESLIRQLLYGHRFFRNEFGVESPEYMLPDCFGFPASLPSILSHCGIRGFSTQKLSWGSAVGIPFNIGVWEGPDGGSVIAALNCGAYDASVTNNLALSKKWRERLDDNGMKSGLFADFQYYGVGDRGGAPDESSVKFIEQSLASNGPVKVISARGDQFFRDITDAQKAKLPKYRGDLLLTEHSAGSLTSQAYMKRWNFRNEQLASAAERAAVAAYLLGGTPYPREKLRRAWELVLGAQFHDILPGTCLPKAYEYSWNDEVIALNNFAAVLEDSVGGVARALDTRVDGIPVVVYNPLSIERQDVVEAELKLPSDIKNVTICDPTGAPVPTQLLSVDGTKHRLIFLAKVPSIGFAVFAAKAAQGSAMPTSLTVGERALENARYRVTLNDAGDIASVFDKSANRELLESPARLALLAENPRDWPAWNMDWSDRQNPPRAYVSGPAKFRIVESGPVRIALEVQRETENSVFVQTLRLSAGSAGDRVEIANRIDWQSTACSLKAEFPLTVSNPVATYNWELGKVERGNNDPKKYEVPTHQWLDLAHPDGDYGVTLLTDAKYGSDKPADSMVRLTLLYSPGTRDAYVEQRSQDWGRHEFVYGLCGHRGDWRAGKSDWQAARLSQPLMAFRTQAHPGALGRSFSLLEASSDQVAVQAVKLAEDNDQIIVRLQELNGQTGARVNLKPGTGFSAVSEVNGLELAPKRLKISGGELPVTLKPYQTRTLACTFRRPAKLTPPDSKPLELPYNLDVFSFNEMRQDGACDTAATTFPAEMIGDSVVSEGIRFHIGPRANGKMNALSCEGQKIALPKGEFNRLYLLAIAINGDVEDTFLLDATPVKLAIQDWSGYVGNWDNRVFNGTVPRLSFSVTDPVERIDAGFIKRDTLAWFCSHRHQRTDTDEIYKFCYLFKYRLDLPPGAQTLTLPVNPRIRVLAVTAARNENDITQAAAPLYDDFSGRFPIQLK